MRSFRDKLPNDTEELKDIIEMQKSEMVSLRKKLKWHELNRTLINSDRFIRAEGKY